MKGNKKREKGNTLSLIVTCALFIVVIGLGLDFLLLLFRGHRRLSNTADAVALQMARDMLRSPKVKLNQGFEMDNWGPVSDNGWVDLYRFNKIVSQVILSTANAAADGSPEAIQAANDLIEHLQGSLSGNDGPGEGTHGVAGNASLAARLKAELIKAAHDFSNGGDVDISVGDAAMLPVSIHPAAMAGGGCRGYVGAPGRCGSKGSESGKPSGFGAGEEGSGGGGGRGSHGGWVRGGSWSTVFTSAPAPGTTTYQSFADGPASSEKAALVSSAEFGSYVDRQGPSNIAINPLSLPLVLGSVISSSNRIYVDNLITKSGKSYVPGYKEVKFKNQSASGFKPFCPVPMEVGIQPHLISTKVFDQNTKANFLACDVPPNAFKFIASTLDGNGRRNLVVSASQVATGPASFTAAFDKGYIEIINIGDRASFDYNGDATTTTNVYAKELMSGIHLADNGAFSTDPNAIMEWALFNDGKTSVQPALVDQNNNLRVHGPTATIHGPKPKSPGPRGDQPCIWMYVTHGNPDYYDPECGTKLPQFEAAYPPGLQTNGDPTSYMATEQFKQTIRSVFNACGSYGCPRESTGLRVYVDGWPGQGVDVNGGNPATLTGRYWRDQINPRPPDKNSKISRPGNVLELLEQIDSAKTASTLELLKNRIYQIKPDITDAKIVGLLKSVELELGECAYIYRDRDGVLKFDNKKPSSMVGNVSNIYDPKRMPTGRKRLISSGAYPTVGTLVNAPKEGGIHLQLYTSYPDPTAVGTAEDMVEETVGIGNNSNLMRLRFINKCGGTGKSSSGAVLSSSGDFCQPD